MVESVDETVQHEAARRSDVRELVVSAQSVYSEAHGGFCGKAICKRGDNAMVGGVQHADEEQYNLPHQDRATRRGRLSPRTPGSRNAAEPVIYHTIY